MAIQPLHNPAQAAYVTHPPGPLNANNDSTVVTVPARANVLLARNEFKARYVTLLNYPVATKGPLSIGLEQCGNRASHFSCLRELSHYIGQYLV